MLTYLNTRTGDETTIDVATASLDDLLIAYNSLIDRSDCGGAFPGSKAWTRAKGFADQLKALIAARPEIEAHRAAVISAHRPGPRDPWTL